MDVAAVRGIAKGRGTAKPVSSVFNGYEPASRPAARTPVRSWAIAPPGMTQADQQGLRNARLMRLRGDDYVRWGRAKSTASGTRLRPKIVERHDSPG